ncbi:hypothetical protein KAM336_17820 [Aeromonas caviae]|uniref:Glycosyltransferase n=3 Tax=Aeromonas caviae TaxID=648 RepID=A0AA37CWB0_AERCA|nr:hypothetical protein KAM336_17820 [Aeromonas caviae]GJA27419.1 hypothetical protein KAM340_15860 [Aeromonas caviae]GJA63043.1 hypothetical protein KAM351_16540 [Aeromonas caviae]
MSRLAFFFPSSGPGGIQSIIIRLIRHAHLNGEPIIVIDYDGGYISTQLKSISNEVFNKHVFIIKSLNDCSFMSEYTFVSFNWQISLAEFFERKYGSRFIYWDVHSNSLDEVLNICVFGRCIKKQKIDRFLSVLTQENRVLTIDLVSKKLIEEKSKSNNITVTGIPISHSEIDCQFSLPSPSQGLHVVYIARAVDWKVVPFYFSMSKILKMYPDFTISCNVYTDNRNDFINLMPYDMIFRSCEISIFDGFSMDEIISRESGRVNLSMGMGTSQFELMLYGVPTLLIPAKTSAPVLEQFDPLWTHMMPDYIYGFDDSTTDIFKSLDLPDNIGLSSSGFSWSVKELVNVKEHANLVMELYSCRTVSKILQNKAREVSCIKSKVWELKEVQLYMHWMALVNFVKKLCGV